MKEVKIGDLVIGSEYPPLVIPEIGINHNGSLKIAKEMVDAAYRAGAKIIKHQTHVIHDEMSLCAQHILPGNANISIYEIMKQAALSYEEEIELKRYVESKNMFYLSTPFSRAAADNLEKMGVEAFKIGSGELNNYPLIEHIANFGKPMIVSTGMNNMRAIELAVNIMEKKNISYALMHTTNVYPTPPQLVRLGAMQEMMINFPSVPIGLSDHTTNNNACIAAIAMGAKVVERHFTDKMDRTGPDIVCSMDEQTLKELLDAANQVYKMLGGSKEATKEEEVTERFAFASVVTIRPIHKGEELTKNNIWVKRPGTGDIPAALYDKVIGKHAKYNIKVDTQLSWDCITE